MISVHHQQHVIPDCFPYPPHQPHIFINAVANLQLHSKKAFFFITQRFCYQGVQHTGHVLRLVETGGVNMRPVTVSPTQELVDRQPGGFAFNVPKSNVNGAQGADGNPCPVLVTGALIEKVPNWAGVEGVSADKQRDIGFMDKSGGQTDRAADVKSFSHPVDTFVGGYHAERRLAPVSHPERPAESPVTEQSFQDVSLYTGYLHNLSPLPIFLRRTVILSGYDP